MELESQVRKVAEATERTAACRRHAERLRATMESRVPRVVAFGLYNAGKSRLLNAIMDHPECFATGAARMTAESRGEAWGNVVLVDTPGLDARLDDPERVREDLQLAALRLFVHSLENGDLEQAESTFLQRLPETGAPLWVVLTKSDRYPPGRSSPEAQLRQQIEVLLPGSAKHFFTVSAKRFEESTQQESRRVSSGVPSLQQRLAAEAPSLTQIAEGIRKGRLKQMVSEILDETCSGIQNLESRWRTRRDSTKQWREQALNAAESLVQQLRKEHDAIF